MTMLKKTMISAGFLRNKDELKRVPDLPGFYKWWAPKKIVKCLLRNYYDELLPKLTKGTNELNGHYYIYVGIATKESIRNRLKWHISQKHTISSVHSGYLSTFRQSISSLVANNQSNEITTNKIIDSLMVEYTTFNVLIKDPSATKKIKEIEKQEMNSNVLPLNIQNQKRPELKNFKSFLKKERKASKEIGIKKLEIKN